MTFPEQIKGVPPALVEQGWRREPSREIKAAWYDAKRPHSIWKMTSLLVGDAWIEIAQPVLDTDGAPHRFAAYYAHQGWGDGMAPTPEMVKVWAFWWLRGHRGDLKVCRVQVHNERDMETADYWIGDRLVFCSEIPEWGTWAGPILPPVR